MFASVLLFVFVGSFIAIVALGHVLLIKAIWPEPFKTDGDPHHAVAGGTKRLHLPN